MKHALTGVLALMFMAGCNSIETKREAAENEKYEQSKEDIAVTEKRKSKDFINLSISNRKNLLGQTVIKGTITNNAKMVTYKDVEVKFNFYSKTRALIGQDVETVYDSIPPGQNTTFKSKSFAPKDTDSVGFEILNVKFK